MSRGLLLDTNVVIWTLSSSERLSAPVKRALSDESETFHVSAVSVWEIVMKNQAGKLDLDAGLEVTLDQILFRSPWQILSVAPEHLIELSALPMLHKDPFDRLLIAQARHERMAILTADANMAKYGVRIVW